jgi:hypothetical protein
VALKACTQDGFCFADSVAAALRSAAEREVGNNCVVAPAELPETLTVSATGPVGYPDYDLWIADYSSVGMSRVDVTAPGGDYFRATDTVQDVVVAAVPICSEIWKDYDPFTAVSKGFSTTDGGGGYVYLNGTRCPRPTRRASRRSSSSSTRSGPRKRSRPRSSARRHR